MSGLDNLDLSQFDKTFEKNQREETHQDSESQSQTVEDEIRNAKVAGTKNLRKLEKCFVKLEKRLVRNPMKKFVYDLS